MEAPVPMDRLLCGDVGYGKTEVAVRAAFKAVMDGKQVGVLVPTTLLAQAHGRVLRAVRPFPVKVAVLSRFQSRQEQDECRRGMADGTVDVVIGTHRLLSADQVVRPGPGRGDEEHRFGVSHKAPSRLRTEVLSLTLTAPVHPDHGDGHLRHPRPVGDGDPARESHPVLTFVGAYDLARWQRHPPGDAPRGPDLLRPQPGRRHRPGRLRGPPGHPRGRVASPAADDRGPARAGDARLLGQGVRRPGLHHHHRVGHRRLEPTP